MSTQPATPPAAPNVPPIAAPAGPAGGAATAVPGPAAATAPGAPVEDPPPTLMLQFARAECLRFQTIQAAARKAVAEAQADLARATKAKAGAAAELARLQGVDANLRQQLQAVATPSAAVTLSGQLTDIMIALRHQAGAIAEAEEAAQLATNDLARAQAAASDAAALAASAEAREADAKSMSDQYNDWTKTLGGPLSSLAADAKAVLASAVYLGAKARVDGADGGTPTTPGATPTPDPGVPGESGAGPGYEAPPKKEAGPAAAAAPADDDGAQAAETAAAQTPLAVAAVAAGTDSEGTPPAGPEIPDALRERARTRRRAEVERRRELRRQSAAFETELEAELLKTGFAGRTTVMRRRLSVAESLVRTYVGTARERYDRALELLAPIATAPPLTEPVPDLDPNSPDIKDSLADEMAFGDAQARSQTDGIAQDVADTAAQIEAQSATVPGDSSKGTAPGAAPSVTGNPPDAGADPAAPEPDPAAPATASSTRALVIAAAEALDAAQADLDRLTAAFVSASSGGDPAADPAVHAARDAVTAAKGELDDAQAAYLEKARPIDEWEIAVPDAAWRRLADFDEATEILCGLAVDAGSPPCPMPAYKGSDPAAMVDALKKAERALVEALAAEATALRTRRIYRGQATTYRDRWSAAAQSAPTRSFSALRGDN